MQILYPQASNFSKFKGGGGVRAKARQAAKYLKAKMLTLDTDTVGRRRKKEKEEKKGKKKGKKKEKIGAFNYSSVHVGVC